MSLKISSDLAILDVKNGRAALWRALHGKNPNLGPSVAGIPITITGFIVYAASVDDGISQEFNVDVKSIDIGAGKVISIALEA